MGVARKVSSFNSGWDTLDTTMMMFSSDFSQISPRSGAAVAREAFQNIDADDNTSVTERGFKDRRNLGIGDPFPSSIEGGRGLGFGARTVLRPGVYTGSFPRPSIAID